VGRVEAVLRWAVPNFCCNVVRVVVAAWYHCGLMAPL